MLVQINSNLYVLASDVVSVKRIMKTNSDNFGKWFANVKHEHGITGYEVPEGDVKFLISDINRFFGK